MSLVAIGAFLLVLMLFLLGSGVWIGITLAIVGGMGMLMFTTLSTAITAKNLFTAFWNANASWELAALPLFIWMGEILFRTRLVGADVHRARAVAQPRPGTPDAHHILGCGIFGSVSGSSAATCATIAKVALPELLRRGYDEKIALGSLATRGHARHPHPAVDHDGRLRGRRRSLDHPHLPRRLHSGLPADGAVLRLHRVVGVAPPRAHSAARAADHARREDQASGQLIPCALLIVFIVVVLVMGWATATECAAYGVLGSLVLAWWGGSLTRRLVPGQPDGRHARVVHDHVHPRGRQVPVDDDGLHRHSARTRRVGRAARTVAVRADRRAERRLHRARLPRSTASR